MRNRTICECFFALIMMYSFSPVDAKEKLYIGPSSTGRINSMRDLQGLSPLEFLDTLKSRRKVNPIICFHFQTKGWIKYKHVRRLALRLNSSEPCSRVISAYASTPPFSLSDEGVEAAHMILGYIRERYPLVLSEGSDEEVKATVANWLKKQNISTGE